MGKKVLIYLLFLSYINTAFMTGEACNGSSGYGSKGKNQEEYNTIVEFVLEGCMDVPDATPEDEDDDIPDSAKTGKMLDYYFNSTFSYHSPILNTKRNTSLFDSFNLYEFIPEKNSPPPKLA